MKKRESIIHIENRLDFFLRSKPKVGLLFCAGLSPFTEHARSRGLFATEETRHGRPSAPAAGAPRHPGAMFASVVRTMMGVNAEPRKFRCARYASPARRASRRGECISDTSSEAHPFRSRPPTRPTTERPTRLTFLAVYLQVRRHRRQRLRDPRRRGHRRARDGVHPRTFRPTDSRLAEPSDDDARITFMLLREKARSFAASRRT